MMTIAINLHVQFPCDYLGMCNAAYPSTDSRRYPGNVRKFTIRQKAARENWPKNDRFDMIFSRWPHCYQIPSAPSKSTHCNLSKLTESACSCPIIITLGQRKDLFSGAKNMTNDHCPLSFRLSRSLDDKCSCSSVAIVEMETHCPLSFWYNCLWVRNKWYRQRKR